MTLTLWYRHHPENARSLKIFALAALANVKVDCRLGEYGVENESEFFIKNCNPAGRFPVLQTDEGFIFESCAIFRHIARLDASGHHLYGKTPFEASQIDMWIDFSTTELNASSVPFLMNYYRGVPLPDDALNNVEVAVASLDTWLENRTFLVGERPTAADVAVAFGLHSIYRLTGDNGEKLANKYKGAFRLYNTIMQHPKVIAVLTAHGATVGPRKAEKENKKVEKKADKKAAENKHAESKNNDDDDDDDDNAQEFQEKKMPNPLDALPPSPFVLDAFKREYSNTDTRTVAAPYFFERFDPNGFTCFWCKYKYNDENKMQFMTANLVRGWFQRMEHLRKYAFGIALLIGEEKHHDLVGFWIFRGQGMPAIVDEVVDTELFDWEQIADIHAEKEKITDYLCWEGPTIPRPVLEGRCFK